MTWELALLEHTVLFTKIFFRPAIMLVLPVKTYRLG
jgi:hypothetical protein